MWSDIIRPIGNNKHLYREIKVTTVSEVTISVDDEFISAGNEIINRLWDNLPDTGDEVDCEIKPCIVQVLRHHRAKTFKYILLTQLLGKAVDDRVNILAMEASSPMEGAWAARSLCEKVITMGGFESNALDNILGASRQPYNSAPGQWPDLRKTNSSSNSLAPIRDSLVDNLPKIKTSKQAENAITYCLVELRDQIEERAAQNPEVVFDVLPQGIAKMRDVLLKIAGLGRNGEGLSLATAMMLHVTVKVVLGCEPRLYKVNSSIRGRGDVDLFDGEERYATFELKDKPFTVDEVIEYARKAQREGCSRFVFLYGPNSGGAPFVVFPESDEVQLAENGILASCVSFDSLLSSLLLIVDSIDLSELYEACDIYSVMALIKPDVVNKAKKLLRNLAR